MRPQHIFLTLPQHLIILLLLLPLLFLPLQAFECFQPPTLLPSSRDCRIIIGGIEWLSTRPAESGPREWGRTIPTTATTEGLPKFYMIQGRRPPNVCAVEIDVEAVDYYAVETFSLADVVEAVKMVYWGCLIARGMLGKEFPNGEQRRVWAKLVRWDLPVGAGEGKRVSGGGNGSLLVLDGLGFGRDGGGMRVETKEGNR